MQLEYLFFVAYIILVILLIPKIPFVKKTGLATIEIRMLLGAKIIIALISAWYFSRFPLSDPVTYNIEGKFQYDLLITNPSLFFSEMKNDIYKYGYGNLFSTSDSFWGYLRFHLIHKFIAFLNIISKGNFYFNSVIFSSLIFLGNICFYRIYSEIYPQRKLLKIAITVFIPSMALYTSCVHKDGLVFLSLGISSYVFYSFLQSYKNLNFKKVAIFLLALLCIFLFRNYVLVALLPAMTVAFIAGKVKKGRGWIIAGIYILATILFFTTGLLKGSFNLPAAVVNRKEAFAQLEKGSTDLDMKKLEPNPISFAKNIPRSINHVLLRPYPAESRNKGVLLASLELYFYLALMLTFILFSRKKVFSPIHAFNIYGFSFFITMVLIIGLTIPNAGAIIRYRSLLWLFLLCPLACNFPLPTKWQKKLN
jgi:hypothetical protein